MKERRCKSCGGDCKKSGCERADAETPQSEYQRGYADAMGWKVQNHLEHLPPQRHWVGLTYGEVSQCVVLDDEGFIKPLAFYREIDAKLKEKNAC